LAFTHPYGCSQLGEDHEATRKILANLATHPNAAGTLVHGLGCENNTMDSFKPLLGSERLPSLRFLIAQDSQDEEAEALRLLEELATRARSFKRESLPLSKLVVGLKCGGSDAFSGITANPLLGRLSELLSANGASPVLTEIPEIFGAETPFLARCASKDVFDKCAATINGFKAYFKRHGQVVSRNRRGNKKGGISTLEEKSLGCVQKGGLGPVRGVVPYGGRVGTPGLNLLDGPGNDIVATTGLSAAGAQIVLFTTGRGTPLGGPVPTLKISTNSDLAAASRDGSTSSRKSSRRREFRGRARPSARLLMETSREQDAQRG
jgi:altronate hydrolase